MRRVLVDSKSHQAVRHLGTEATHYPGDSNAGAWQGKRLTGLAADLAAQELELVFDDLTNQTLAEASVLIVSGRSDHMPFTENELSEIKAFCKRGHGLFLMANHCGFVHPQNQLADVLGLPIRFRDITKKDLRPQIVANPVHETSLGCTEGLRFRISCALSIGEGFVETVVDENAEAGCIAAASSEQWTSMGRVMVSISAGHIARRIAAWYKF